CHRRIHRTGKIELSIAIRVRTGKFKERPGRWMQYVRLRSGRRGTRTLEDQLQAQLLNRRKGHAQRERGCAIAAQSIATLLACDSGARRAHDSLPEVGLPGAVGTSPGTAATVSPSPSG